MWQFAVYPVFPEKKVICFAAAIQCQQLFPPQKHWLRQTNSS